MSLSSLPSLGTFLDPAAIAIVVGGTAASTILRTPARDLANGVAALATLGRSPFAADGLLSQIDALSRISARHGVLQLDRSVIADPDVALAMAAIVDGAEPHDVRAVVEHARCARFERQRVAADMWAAAAEIAPAMGLIGTLIGLVRMFSAMNDPATIGGAMAIALLTTLYGALLANLVAMPVAARLKRRARTECLERARLAAPLEALATRELPRWRERAA